MRRLTPIQCKTARAALGLSQSKVAAATGINRSVLALFEVHRYILEDRILDKLRAFYESQGCTFDKQGISICHSLVKQQHVGHSTKGMREREKGVIDSFPIPSTLGRCNTEKALSEIQYNDSLIEEIMARPVKCDFIFGDICSEPADRVFALMARNYALVRFIQGNRTFASEGATTSREPKTYGDVVREKINS